MTIRNSTTDLDLGFGRYDSEQYQQYKPKVQLLIPKEPPKAEQVKYCSSCNKKIEWLEASKRFICYSCGVTYHELFDTPLASVDQAIRPLQSNDPYEKVEPAFISVKPKSAFTEGRNRDEATQVTGTMRKAHIKTTNLARAMDEKWIRSQFEDGVY